MSAKLHKLIVKAWVEKDGKYLLAQRGTTEKHHSGVWSLPGGNVELDITDSILEKTLKKEIKEEIGIAVADQMQLIYNNSFIKDSDGSHVVNLTFLCKWQAGEAKPLEDTAKVAWYTMEELQKLENAPDFLVKEIEKLVKYTI